MSGLLKWPLSRRQEQRLIYAREGRCHMTGFSPSCFDSLITLTASFSSFQSDRAVTKLICRRVVPVVAPSVGQCQRWPGDPCHWRSLKRFQGQYLSLKMRKIALVWPFIKFQLEKKPKQTRKTQHDPSMRLPSRWHWHDLCSLSFFFYPCTFFPTTKCSCTTMH